MNRFLFTARSDAFDFEGMFTRYPVIKPDLTRLLLSETPSILYAIMGREGAELQEILECLHDCKYPHGDDVVHFMLDAFEGSNSHNALWKSPDSHRYLALNGATFD